MLLAAVLSPAAHADWARRPGGEVTHCRVVPSELNDAELERNLVARIRMLRFGDKDVEVVTTIKSIEFFPT